jgi:DNA-binding winged helix-turn-helix (wHTH) protein
LEGRFVTDYALNNLIATLRKQLCSKEKNQYIVTIPKRGYRLAAKVYYNTDSASSVLS